MNQQGSDKARPFKHNYTRFYNYVFQDYRHSFNHVFELGIGTMAAMGVTGVPGASLRGWREFFPNAQIIGADIDREVQFEEERIKTHWVDQMDPTAIAELWAAAPEPFELMIDDGWHSYHANEIFLRNSVDRLRKGGFFIVEDIYADEPTLRQFHRLLHELFVSKRLNSAILNIPLEGNDVDNCIAVATYA